MKKTGHPIGLLYPSILPEYHYKFLRRSDLMLTVRHDKVIIYKGKFSSHNAKKRDPLCDKNLLKRSYQGILSKSAIKFISKQVTLWADSISTYNDTFNHKGKSRQRQLVFLTVTLPAKQKHSDLDIKRHLLIPFIDSLKYHFGIKHYFWRAEAQKNGNIHFHIILDKYIPYHQARDLWNNKTEKLGYVTRFAKKNGHFKPNSIDIRSIDNTKNTIKYVLKYATKETEGRLLSGRLWGMSDTIRSLRMPTFSDINELIKPILYYIKKHKVKYLFEEHFMSVPFKTEVVKALNNTVLSRVLKDLYFKIYSYLYFEDSPFDDNPSFTIYQGLDYDEIKSISKTV